MKTPAPAETSKPEVPKAPPVPDRDYFTKQIARLEADLAQAEKTASEIRGGLTLARGQLAMFFPEPAAAPAAK